MESFFIFFKYWKNVNLCQDFIFCLRLNSNGDLLLKLLISNFSNACIRLSLLSVGISLAWKHVLDSLDLRNSWPDQHHGTCGGDATGGGVHGAI